MFYKLLLTLFFSEIVCASPNWERGYLGETETIFVSGASGTLLDSSDFCDSKYLSKTAVKIEGGDYVSWGGVPIIKRGIQVDTSCLSDASLKKSFDGAVWTDTEASNEFLRVSLPLVLIFPDETKKHLAWIITFDGGFKINLGRKLTDGIYQFLPETKAAIFDNDDFLGWISNLPQFKDAFKQFYNGTSQPLPPIAK